MENRLLLSGLFTVTNTDDIGVGSLRQAILDANATVNVSGPDTIEFNIPGTGPHTIQPGSALPTVTDPVVIDGYTQPGASRNTQALGSDAVLRIELDGTNAGKNAAGLWVTAGNSVVCGLVINRFGDHGVNLEGEGSNLIEGNYIGTDFTGTVDLGNVWDGVYAWSASYNTIGGTSAGARNVISGNQRNGVTFEGDASHNVVLGNYIGVDRSGQVALANGAGVALLANGPGPSHNTIGADAAGAGNVISGNAGTGVRMQGSGGASIQTADNRVLGNLIGTDASGTEDLGNLDGVVIQVGAENNTIGGTTPGARNVISGNDRYGVRITNAGSTGNVVQGNYIGSDITGIADLGNGEYGLYVDGPPDNTIGGAAPGEANVIAFNTGSGVAIVGSSSTGNAIRGNSIFDNAGLGIGLNYDGITLNDPDDADIGPNQLQNFPEVSLAEPGTTTRVAGSLDSVANTAFTLDFYANSVADPSGYGEGERWLASTIVTTDPNGDAAFHVTLLAATQAGEVITATATDSDGNTSEFSAGVLLEITNQPPTADGGGPYEASEGSAITFNASPSSDPDGDPLQYRWDFDNDGTWDTEYSADATADYTWNDDYSGEVVVEVFDGQYADTAAALVTVYNVAPLVDPIVGPIQGVRGQPLSYVGTFSDVGTLDTHTLEWTVTYAGGPQVCGGRLCDRFGKPLELTFEYTGGGEDATHTQQPESKYSVTGDPNEAATVHILASSKGKLKDVDPSNTFFDGVVNLGDEFTLDVDNAGKDKFGSKTFIYILDADDDLLQTVEYHTSCSAPIVLGDVIGGVTLTEYVGEGGMATLPEDPTIFASGSGPNFTFVPTQLGVYTVTFTVTDDDTGQDSTSLDVAIGRTYVEDGVLYIGGTNCRDHIDVKKGKEPGTVEVKIDEKDTKIKTHGTFGPTIDKVVVYAQGGDDKVHVHNNTELVATELYGGPGDDKLKSGRSDDLLDGGPGDDDLKADDGNDVLIGGDGDDKLNGGKGLDLLIGGDGADDIKGGSDGGKDAPGDILIAGWTSYDDNVSQLQSILDEWIAGWDAGTDYDDIVDGLIDPLTGSLVPGVTVFDDGVADKVKGSNKARDLFFADLDGQDDDDDELTDRKPNELVDEVYSS